MKYKFIELEYLILCLERLTRFKPSLPKYQRVFDDILNKYYLEPHNNLSDTQKISIVTEIFNNSVEKSGGEKSNLFFNHLLQKEERGLFCQNNQSEALICAPLNIEGLLGLIKDDVPINLKRLLILKDNKDKKPTFLREKFALKYPIEKVILSEGATEEILLSEFAKIYGCDFDKMGIEVIAAGGKNQVAKKYYQMTEEVKIPIFILLDSDATQTCELILPKLRKKDEVYLIKSGEFEDIIPKEIIINTLNNSFKNLWQVEKDDFNNEFSTVKNLKEIYKNKGFGDFQKAEFAKNLKNYLKSGAKPSQELSLIIEKIKG